jgi:hypothetical protein
MATLRPPKGIVLQLLSIFWIAAGGYATWLCLREYPLLTALPLMLALSSAGLWFAFPLARIVLTWYWILVGLAVLVRIGISGFEMKLLIRAVMMFSFAYLVWDSESAPDKHGSESEDWRS